MSVRICTKRTRDSVRRKRARGGSPGIVGWFIRRREPQARAKGRAVVTQTYEAYHDTRPGEESSAVAITLGYQWLTVGRIGHAVTLLRLSAERFPSDANAQFHLGEAFRYTGRPAEAAEQYRTVLSLHPEHANAAARLAEVGEAL